MAGLVAQIGARVELRRPTARDADAFLRMVNHSRELHIPWVYPPADREAFSAYLQRLRGRRHIGFLVCLRDVKRSGAIAGAININEITLGNFQSAALGYMGSAEHAGCGYMTEGMNLALRHAFRTLGLHRLEANIQPANERSIALVKRCGFRYEGFSPKFLRVGGEWRDHERWAILAGEWEGRRSRRGSESAE